MVLDGIIALFLLMTTVFCWRAAVSLQKFKRFSKGLPAAVDTLGGISERIGRQLHALKTSEEQSLNALRQQLPKASALKEDLEVLCEHCERLCLRMDNLIAQAKEVEDNLRAIRGERSYERTSAVTGSHTGQQPARSRTEDEIRIDLPGVPPVSDRGSGITKSRSRNALLSALQNLR